MDYIHFIEIGMIIIGVVATYYINQGKMNSKSAVISTQVKNQQDKIAEYDKNHKSDINTVYKKIDKIEERQRIAEEKLYEKIETLGKDITARIDDIKNMIINLNKK